MFCLLDLKFPKNSIESAHQIVQFQFRKCEDSHECEGVHHPPSIAFPLEHVESG